MVDRAQTWTIVADFSSLTREARKAARAVKELDQERQWASKHADTPLVNNKTAIALETEKRQLDKLSEALKKNVEARRKDSDLAKTALKHHQDLATHISRSASARQADTDSLERHASAMDKSNMASGGAVSASAAVSKSFRRTSRDTDAATRSVQAMGRASTQLSGGMGVLQRAIADLIPTNRSWSLVMKMLPLTAVTSGVNSLIPAINGLGGAMVGLLGTMGPLFGTLSALPSMLVGVAGGVGGIVAGLSNVAGAMGKYNKMQEAQEKAANKATKTNDRAIRTRERSIRNANRSLEKARRDQVRNAEEIQDAEARIGEVAAENAQRIADAEDTIADAHEDAARAQKAVTQARLDAARALDDYRAKLRGATLDEEGAIQELQRARATLAATMADPGATDLERKSADLAVRQAEHRLEEVATANRALEKEAATAQAKGIENSDLVVEAKEAEADANEKVIDAQKGLERVYQDNAKSAKDAQRSLADSRQAYEDGAERVRDLEEDLVDLNLALKETAEVADPAADEIKAFEEAMAKLSPTQRKIVEELIDMKDAWSDIKDAAGEAIAPGTLSLLRDMHNSLLPDVSKFLTNMAEGTGRWFVSLGEVLSERSNIENLRDVFDDAYDVMDLLGEATLNVYEWLIGLGAAARKSGLTRWVGDVIRSWTEGWKQLVDTPEGIDNVAKSMEESMYFAELWGDAISSTWGFLRTFFRGFRPLGVWVLENIRDTTDAWNNFLRSPDGRDKLRTWQELATINLSGLAGFIGTIADQGVKMFDGIDFQRVWDSINGVDENSGLINALGDLLGIVTEDMIVNVIDLGTAIAGILQSIGESGAMNAVVGFVDVLGNFADIADRLMDTIPFLSEAVAVLIASFAAKKFVTALGGLTGASAIIGAMGQATAQGYGRGDGLGRAAAMNYWGLGNFVPDRTTESGAAKYDATQAARNQKQAANIARQFGYGPVIVGGTTQWAPKGGASGKPMIGLTPNLSASESIPSGSHTAAMSNIEKQTKATGNLRGAVNNVRTAWMGVGGALKSVLGGVAIMGIISAATAGLQKLNEYLTGTTGTAEEAEIAINNFNDSLRKGKSSEEAIKSLDKLFEGLKTATGGSYDLRSALQDLNLVDRTGWFDRYLNPTFDKMAYSEAAGNVDKLRETFKLLDTELRNANPEEAAASFAAIRDMAEELGIPLEDLIHKYLPDYASQLQLLASQNGLGELSTEELADAMAGLHPDIQRIREETKKATKATEENTEKLDFSTDAYKRNKDAIDSVIDSQRRAAGQWSSSQEANDRFAEAMLTANEQIAENNKLLGESTDKLGDNTAGGLANRALLRDLTQLALDAAQAKYEETGSYEEANAIIAEHRKQIGEVADQFFATDQEAKDYLDDLGLIPAYVGTTVAMEGVNLTEEEAKRLNKLIEDLPDDAKIDIIAEAQEEGFEEALEMYNSIPAVKEVSIQWTGTGGANHPNQGGRRLTLPDGGWAEGGWTGPGSKYTPAGVVHADEFVMSKSSRRSIESAFPGALDFMNRTGRMPGYAAGGRVKALSYATGGRVASTGGRNGYDDLMAQFNYLTSSASAVGGWMRTWGSRLEIWWKGMWERVARQVQVSTSSVTSTLAGPWAAAWNSSTTVVDTALAKAHTSVLTSMVKITSAITSFTGPMTAAWTAVMNTMKEPITDGLNFINNTLGTAVNKIATFYGVTDTPFPIDVPGFSAGGWTGRGSKYQPAGVVHADEYVIQKSSRQNIERQAPGALDYMNRTGRMPGYATGGRVRPVSGRESNNYRGHSGIDYAVGMGTPVRAADGGVITGTRKLNYSYGWHIVQRLAEGLKAVYAHLSGFNVAVGDSVSRGQVIGFSGNSGNSRGPHLHFEVTGGGFGAASNRDFTRQWLAQAGSVDSMLGAVSGMGSPVVEGALQKLVASISDSPWGQIVGKAVSQMAGWAGNLLGTGSAAGNFGTGTQRDNAFGIIDIAMRRGLGHRGALLGLMTAMQESSLRNLSGGDRDSVGLFQQRPSMGWGSVAQIMDPTYSANKFFDALMRRKGWQTGPEWEDIQAVQISAFPTAYQKHKGRALAYIEEWMAARGQGFSRGGWTGPGARDKAAGVVHADEYVIKKSSRRRLENVAPGLLDYMNANGTLPGYAAGGKVGDPAKWVTPRTLRNTKVFLTYLEKAQKLAQTKATSVPETKVHVQMLENLLAHEGLLWRKDADGWFGKADTLAWTAWQKRAGYAATGKIEAASLTKLLKKYNIPYDMSTPYVPGIAQPRPEDVLLRSLTSQNAQMGQFHTYLNKFKTLGFSYLMDHLKQLGPNGIPEEYRDSTNPVTGIQLAKNLADDAAAARKYNEALKAAAKFNEQEQTSAMEGKLEEMITLLRSGEDGPYGLQGLARELGVSIDTAAQMYKKLVSSGRLKDVPNSRTSRVRGDIVDFDNLFRFSKGGIVPGYGNTDSVHALLTPGELVVPKDVVSSILRADGGRSSFMDVSSRISNRTDTNGAGGRVVQYNFNTEVNNPVAEPASSSIQRRVRDVALTGFLGRNDD